MFFFVCQKVNIKFLLKNQFRFRHFISDNYDSDRFEGSTQPNNNRGRLLSDFLPVSINCPASEDNNDESNELQDDDVLGPSLQRSQHIFQHDDGC